MFTTWSTFESSKLMQNFLHRKEYVMWNGHIFNMETQIVHLGQILQPILAL